MEHTGFPSDETLAAFLDGRLDPETRRRVIEHMTTCDECYSVVAAAGLGGPQKDKLSSNRLTLLPMPEAEIPRIRPAATKLRVSAA